MSKKILFAGAFALGVFALLKLATGSTPQTGGQGVPPADIRQAIQTQQYQAPERPQDVQQRQQTFSVTAAQLQAMYDENEVAADQRMMGLTIQVNGPVLAIEKDFTNGTVVRLATGNDDYHYASFYLSHSEDNAAAQLRRGMTVTIRCKRVARLVGAPSGSECVFG